MEGIAAKWKVLCRVGDIEFQMDNSGRIHLEGGGRTGGIVGYCQVAYLKTVDGREYLGVSSCHKGTLPDLMIETPIAVK